MAEKGRAPERKTPREQRLGASVNPGGPGTDFRGGQTPEVEPASPFYSATACWLQTGNALPQLG